MNETHLLELNRVDKEVELFLKQVEGSWPGACRCNTCKVEKKLIKMVRLAMACRAPNSIPGMCVGTFFASEFTKILQEK